MILTIHFFLMKIILIKVLALNTFKQAGSLDFLLDQVLRGKSFYAKLELDHELEHILVTWES